ncbi:hypothetical protein NIT60_12095 [Mammaliicoccus sciuri]|nr:hypothetical protein NIT60_12095 [Mammaliicoccus sciuri]
MKYIHKSKDWLIENYQLAIIMIVVLFFICNSLFTGNDDHGSYHSSTRYIK